ncbi:MAG: thymidine phosphorylase [Myxococcota bacterium]
MRAVDLIRIKRDGGHLTAAQVRSLVEGYVAQAVGDDQMAAFAMAVFFCGMSSDELSALVRAMIASGDVIDLSEVPGIKVDKHSTGGVGDKISLCLAPLVASCGVPVPMISGRGLGHTGGTLDKLAAIPGFRTDLDVDRFGRLVADHGLALCGQTERLVPADRRLYALRDVTATVESIPLIAASIMSKKLAEGIDGLVLDVKVGSGAFMKSMEDATALARTMIEIGEQMNKTVRALLTNMDQPLGRAIGNANETWEAIEVLKGGGPADVVELTIELGAEMLVVGKAAADASDGRRRMRQAIADGRGLDRMRAIIEAQGGDARVLDRREAMPVAAHDDVVRSTSEGVVVGFDTEAVGRAAMVLGAGRARSTDTVDHAVGFEMMVRPGTEVKTGDALARIAYNDEAKRASAEQVFLAAVQIGEAAPAEVPLVRGRCP